MSEYTFCEHCGHKISKSAHICPACQRILNGSFPRRESRSFSNYIWMTVGVIATIYLLAIAVPYIGEKAFISGLTVMIFVLVYGLYRGKKRARKRFGKKVEAIDTFAVGDDYDAFVTDDYVFFFSADSGTSKKVCRDLVLSIDVEYDNKKVPSRRSSITTIEYLPAEGRREKVLKYKFKGYNSHDLAEASESKLREYLPALSE